MQRIATGKITSSVSAGEVERRPTMAKTKSFKELVQNRVKADKRFAEALLREGVDAMLSGDADTGKTILRDYIKATVGFEKLGAATGAPSKSLIRMFGQRGNPQGQEPVQRDRLPAETGGSAAARVGLIAGRPCRFPSSDFATLSRQAGRGKISYTTSTFLNCHGSSRSKSSGNNPGRPASGVQSVYCPNTLPR